jgi:hypothetical protein
MDQETGRQVELGVKKTVREAFSQAWGSRRYKRNAFQRLVADDQGIRE